MIEFIQHVPTFVDGVIPFIVFAENQEELLANPFFNRFKNDPCFFRFSMAGDWLMQETCGGRRYYVLGHVSEALDLPEWEEPEEIKIPEGMAMLDFYDGFDPLAKSECEPIFFDPTKGLPLEREYFKKRMMDPNFSKFTYFDQDYCLVLEVELKDGEKIPWVGRVFGVKSLDLSLSK